MISKVVSLVLLTSITSLLSACSLDFKSLGARSTVGPAVTSSTSNLSITDGAAITDLPDGTPNAMLVHGNTLYLGGTFRYLSPSGRSYAVRTSLTSGAVSTLSDVPDGDVNVSVADGSGGWFIGGAFTHLGANSIQRLAHFMSDGTLDLSFAPNPDGAVNALRLSGGKLYLGGAFTQVAGTGRANIAAVDPATGLLDSWVPAMPVPGTSVSAIEIVGSHIYLGAGAGLYSFDKTSAAQDLGFAPAPNDVVLALTSDGASLFVGGSFTSIGGASMTGLAALSLTTGASVWGTDPAIVFTVYSNPQTPVVRALKIAGGALYIASDSSSMGGQPRKGFGAINLSDGSLTAWNPALDDGYGSPYGSANSIEIIGSTVYLGGSFTSVNGQVRAGIAAVDATSGATLPWYPEGGAQSKIYTFLPVGSGDDLLVGGRFTGFGGGVRLGVAAIDLATGKLTSWNPKFFGGYTVKALAADGNTIYVAGNFNQVNGVTRNSLAAFDATTGAVTAFNPNFSSSPMALAASNGVVYAVGSFNTVAGGTVIRRNAAALDGVTGVATAWNPDPNSAVLSVAVKGNSVYLGGVFSSFASGTISRQNFAEIDAMTGVPTALNVPFSASVTAVAVGSESIYVGGNFSHSGTTLRNYAASISLSDGTLTAWDPALNGSVSQFRVTDSSVYLAGFFSSVAGTPMPGLVEVSTDTGAMTSWSPSFTPSSYGKLITGLGVMNYVAGYFNGGFNNVYSVPR